MALSRLVSLDSAPDMNIYIYIFFCYSVTCCAALYIFLIHIHFWNLITCFRFAAKEYQSYKHRSSRYWFNIFFLYFYFGLSGSGEYYFRISEEKQNLFLWKSHTYGLLSFSISREQNSTLNFEVHSSLADPCQKNKKQHWIIESPTRLAIAGCFLNIWEISSDFLLLTRLISSLQICRE